MTDEQIVEAAKSAEKKTEFGELVHSKVSRGVNSAYGIGFLEGAEWTREQMLKEAVVADVNVYRDLAEGESWAEFVVRMPTENLGDKVHMVIIKEGEK